MVATLAVKQDDGFCTEEYRRRACMDGCVDGWQAGRLAGVNSTPKPLSQLPLAGAACVPPLTHSLT